MKRHDIPVEQDIAWTARQRQVLDLLARGKTNPEIADILGVSLAGAKWHVSEVISRLGVTSREEAAAWWQQRRSGRTRLTRTLRGFVALPLARIAGAAGGLAAAGAAVVLMTLPLATSEGDRRAPEAIEATPTPQGPPPHQQVADLPFDLGSPDGVRVLQVSPEPELGTSHYILGAHAEPLTTELFRWIESANILGPAEEHLWNPVVLRVWGEREFSVAQATDCAESRECVASDDIVLWIDGRAWRLNSPEAAAWLRTGWQRRFASVLP